MIDKSIHEITDIQIIELLQTIYADSTDVDLLIVIKVATAELLKRQFDCPKETA